MNANLIVFLRGSGGNFLSRILTLDPSTVPLGGVVGSSVLTTKERFDNYYYYSNQFNNKNFNLFLDNGLSTWVDKELNQYYFPLTIGVEKLIELNLTVVEPIHPDHFDQKFQYFGVDDQIQLFYINPTNCIEWIVDQKLHKGAYAGKITLAQAKQQTLDELGYLTALLEKHNFISISLENIIRSETDFLIEYNLMCKNFNLVPFCTESLEIYRSWEKTWKQSDHEH